MKLDYFRIANNIEQEINIVLELGEVKPGGPVELFVFAVQSNCRVSFFKY